MRICQLPYIWFESLATNVGYPCVFCTFGHNEVLSINVVADISNFVLCRFYFDFSMTYVGAGMICSHLVNLSLLLGAVLSWGLMWPLIEHQKGDWFPSTLSEGSMKSLNGYKVDSFK